MQLDCLHGGDSHDFMTWRIIDIKHCVEDPFEVANFVWCV